MARVELIMPKMGESIMEATILTWIKKPGDKIEQDESVLEVATDKVDTEVPTTHEGILKEILVKEGEVVQVGTPIAIIATEGEESDSTTVPDVRTEKADPIPATVKSDVIHTQGSNGSSGIHHAHTVDAESSRFYSPLVKNIAREENIDVKELNMISGTGA